jgi:hypothetical protein
MDPGILLMAILFLGIIMYGYIVYKERDDIKIPEVLIVGGTLLVAAYAIITNLFI